MEVAHVDERLPLARLDQPGGEYLVAWDGGDPVGHAFVEWDARPPLVGDVFVVPERRREGIATALTAAAEQAARERGFTALELTVSVANDGARRLYEQLGYLPTGDEPRRVEGTIVIRGRAVEVDDTLLPLRKHLGAAVDFGEPRSS